MGQEEKGTTEDETAGWHHRLDGHELGTEQQCVYTALGESELEKTLESPLDCKEIQPVHPEGDQS